MASLVSGGLVMWEVSGEDDDLILYLVSHTDAQLSSGPRPDQALEIFQFKSDRGIKIAISKLTQSDSNFIFEQC